MTVQVHNDSQFTKHDISVELFREYIYGNGERLRIDDPQTMFLKTDIRGDSHRIVSADGSTYYPRRGWVGIRWAQRDGKAVAF
jgi:hypothetical protein